MFKVAKIPEKHKKAFATVYFNFLYPLKVIFLLFLNKDISLKMSLFSPGSVYQSFHKSLILS